MIQLSSNNTEYGEQKMKKHISPALSLIILMQSLTLNISAADSEKKNGNYRHALEIFKKFSIPISASVCIIGIGGYACYKYKHQNRKINITGEVTKERMDDIFREVEKIKKAKHNCTLVFKDATVKPRAFEDRIFYCDVLFTGECKIERNACNLVSLEKLGTIFCGKFEIDGTITEGSSFENACFNRGDIIINKDIPKNLFKGAVVLAKRAGTKYKLPKKQAIVVSNQNNEKIAEYLKEYFY